MRHYGANALEVKEINKDTKGYVLQEFIHSMPLTTYVNTNSCIQIEIKDYSSFHM